MNTLVIGSQWGDEGKGKIVDVLTPQYDVVARFQGGPNAGHTLEFGGKKFVLRSIPSGIFQGGQLNIIGNGVVLDPSLFMGEAMDLEKAGYDFKYAQKREKFFKLLSFLFDINFYFFLESASLTDLTTIPVSAKRATALGRTIR